MQNTTNNPKHQIPIRGYKKLINLLQLCENDKLISKKEQVFLVRQKNLLNERDEKQDQINKLNLRNLMITIRHTLMVYWTCFTPIAMSFVVFIPMKFFFSHWAAITIFFISVLPVAILVGLLINFAIWCHQTRKSDRACLDNLSYVECSKVNLVIALPLMLFRGIKTVSSEPSLLTPTTFLKCYQLVSRSEDPQASPEQNGKITTLFITVLDREFAELQHEQENGESLTEGEQDRIASLFEIMIKLDIDTFMEIACKYHCLLPSILANVHSILEQDDTFRRSDAGLKVFQAWVSHPKEETIDPEEYQQVVTWAEEYIMQHPEETAKINQSMQHLRKMLTSDMLFKINSEYTWHRHATQGISTEEKRIDLAFPKISPLDTTLNKLGGSSRDPIRTQALQSARINTNSLDLAGLERRRTIKGRHPIAYDAMRRFENEKNNYRPHVAA